MGPDIDYFINSVKRSVLSFVLVNLFSLSIVFIFYPMMEKPENIFADRSGQLSTLPLRDKYYFKYFLGELTILILALFLGVLISSFILKSYSGIVKSLANPWFSSFMWLLPIFFLQLSDLEVESDNPSSIYPYIILIITFYTTLIILRGMGSISPDEPNNFHIQYLLIIVKKRSPVFVNLLFLMSFYFGIRSSAFYFYKEVSSHLRQDGLNLHIGILALSLQILILQLILGYAISRVLNTKSFEEVSPLIIRKNNKKSKDLIMLILLIVTTIISIILFFMSLVPRIFYYEWVIFLRNPFYSDLEFSNSFPSISHWFGTDQSGLDIFSILLFSISAFLFISYMISLIHYRLALDFLNVTDKIISKSKRISLYQILGGFPSIPILLLISILRFPLRSWLIYYPIILLIMSIFSWVHTSELLEYNQEDNEKKTTISKMFHPIILKSVNTNFLNLIILSYLGVSRGNFPRIGETLIDSQNNLPNIYWWAWLFPIVIIAFTIALLRPNEDASLQTNYSL